MPVERCRPADPDRPLDAAVDRVRDLSEEKAIRDAMDLAAEWGEPPEYVARRMRNPPGRSVAWAIVRERRGAAESVDPDEAIESPNATISADNSDRAPNTDDVAAFHGDPLRVGAREYRTAATGDGIAVYRGGRPGLTLGQLQYVGRAADNEGARRVAEADAKRKNRLSELRSGAAPSAIEAAREMGALLKRGYGYGKALGAALHTHVTRATTNRLAGMRQFGDELYNAFWEASSARQTQDGYTALWADFLKNGAHMDDETRTLLGRYMNELQLEAETASGHDVSQYPHLTAEEMARAENDASIAAAMAFYKANIEPFAETMALANDLPVSQLNKERRGVYVKISRVNKESVFPEGDPRNELPADAFTNPESPYYIPRGSRSAIEALQVGKAKATLRFKGTAGDEGPVELVDDPVEMVRLMLRDRTETGMLRALRDAIYRSPHGIGNEDALHIALALSKANPDDARTMDALWMRIAAAKLPHDAIDRVAAFAQANIGSSRSIPQLMLGVAGAVIRGPVGKLDLFAPWLDEGVEKSLRNLSDLREKIIRADKKGDEKARLALWQQQADLIQRDPAIIDFLGKVDLRNLTRYVPQRVADEWDYLKDYYSGKRWRTGPIARALQKWGGSAVALRMLSGAALLRHTANILYQASSTTLPGDKSLARNALALIGAGPLDTAWRASSFFKSPEGQRVYKLLLAHGGVNVHTFSEYVRDLSARADRADTHSRGLLTRGAFRVAGALSQVADQLRSLVFGFRGMDPILRTYAASKYIEIYRRLHHADPDPVRVAEHINGVFGNYVPALMGWAMDGLRRQFRMFPFGPSQFAIMPDEMAQMFGHIPKDVRPKGLGAHLAYSLQTMLAREIGFMVAFTLLNVAFSGHTPWQNGQRHELDLEFGRGGKKYYFPIKYFSPSYRPARMLGLTSAPAWIADIYATGQGSSDLLTSVPAAAGKEVTDYLLSNTFGAPAYRPLFIMGTGAEPWLTSNGGGLGLLGRPSVPGSIHDFLVNRVLQSAASITPATENIWPLFPRYNDSMGQRITDWAYGVLGGAGRINLFSPAVNAAQPSTAAPYVNTAMRDTTKSAMNSPARWNMIPAIEEHLPANYIQRVAAENAAAKNMIAWYVDHIYEAENSGSQARRGLHVAVRVMRQTSRALAEESAKLDVIRQSKSLSVAQKRAEIRTVQDRAFQRLAVGVAQANLAEISDDPTLSPAQRETLSAAVKQAQRRAVAPASGEAPIPPSPFTGPMIF